MLYIDKNSYVLSCDEYNKLTNPDVTYTLMTKTSANKAVNNILQYANYICWHDDIEFLYDNFCSECPVMEILGEEAGNRICLRQKRTCQ